jgi:hypothetical protein
MSVRSLAFDDDEDDDLHVFSGNDLLVAHYDVADLDWREVAERAAIDERRGLVIAQVAVLEDLIDEFLMYLEDPVDPPAFQDRLDGMTIGPRLEMLESLLDRSDLLGPAAAERIADLRAVASRRNQLAHGTIDCQLARIPPVSELSHQDIEVEWILVDRRTRTREPITMSRLRRDLEDAIGAFTAMLSYAEEFVVSAPVPEHFVQGAYLAARTP